MGIDGHQIVRGNGTKMREYFGNASRYDADAGPLAAQVNVARGEPSSWIFRREPPSNHSSASIR